MAFVATFGALTGDKTAGTSITSPVFGGTIPAGSLVIVGIAKDNAATADGQTSEITSVTDTQSNTYTKVIEFCNGQGAANAGATVSLWRSVITTALTTSDTVTANFSDSRTASAIFAKGFTKVSNSTISSLGTNTLANDGADPGSLTSSGLSAGTQYLTVRATAYEAAAVTSTPTTSWTVGDAGTSGSSGASNMSISMEWIIQTGATSMASDPTVTAADCASVIASFYEVAAIPASYPPVHPGEQYHPFLVR